MANCLVTKLKAFVDNDNLQTLGKMKFVFDSACPYSSAYFMIGYDPNNPITLNWLKPGGPSFVHNQEENRYYLYNLRDINLNNTLIVDNKYGITEINASWCDAKININELSGIKIKKLYFGKGNLNDSINDIPSSLNDSLTDLGYCDMYGDMSRVAKFTNLEIFDGPFYDDESYTCRINGKLSELSSLKKLIRIVVPEQVTGTLTDLTCYDTLEIIYSKINGGYTNIISNDCSQWATLFKNLRSSTWWCSNLVWNSPTLRDSSYSMINLQCYFATSADTDNFLINMASCFDSGLIPNQKNYYLQQSVRTSASDAAVSKLEATVFVFYQVIKQ